MSKFLETKLSLQDPLDRARCSLEGLSVGDSFGETFFVNPDLVEGLIEERALAARTWNYTDDTLMAMSIFSVLRQYGYIDQPTLARSFAERYESTRGYGPAMHRLLWEIKCGEDWAERAQSQFGGKDHSATAQQCVSLQWAHSSLMTLMLPLSRQLDHLS